MPRHMPGSGSWPFQTKPHDPPHNNPMRQVTSHPQFTDKVAHSRQVALTHAATSGIAGLPQLGPLPAYDIIHLGDKQTAYDSSASSLSPVTLSLALDSLKSLN